MWFSEEDNQRLQKRNEEIKMADAARWWETSKRHPDFRFLQYTFHKNTRWRTLCSIWTRLLIIWSLLSIPFSTLTRARRKNYNNIFFHLVLDDFMQLKPSPHSSVYIYRHSRTIKIVLRVHLAALRLPDVSLSASRIQHMLSALVLFHERCCCCCFVALKVSLRPSLLLMLCFIQLHQHHQLSIHLQALLSSLLNLSLSLHTHTTAAVSDEAMSQEGKHANIANM